jgi:hypothetical protein
MANQNKIMTYLGFPLNVGDAGGDLEGISSCPDGSPEMLVTVIGGTGDVTWCGLTWTEEQRGETRVLCPDRYERGLDIYFYTYPTYPYPKFWSYTWLEKWGAGQGQLYLQRKYNIVQTSGLTWQTVDYLVTQWKNLVQFFVATPTPTLGQERWEFSGLGGDTRPIPVTNSFSPNNPKYKLGGILKNSPPPRPDDYLILDIFFSSYTDQNGVTYKWERNGAFGW